VLVVGLAACGDVFHKTGGKRFGVTAAADEQFLYATIPPDGRSDCWAHTQDFIELMGSAAVSGHPEALAGFVCFGGDDEPAVTYLLFASDEALHRDAQCRQQDMRCISYGTTPDPSDVATAERAVLRLEDLAAGWGVAPHQPTSYLTDFNCEDVVRAEARPQTAHAEASLQRHRAALRASVTMYQSEAAAQMVMESLGEAGPACARAMFFWLPFTTGYDDSDPLVADAVIAEGPRVVEPRGDEIVAYERRTDAVTTSGREQSFYYDLTAVRTGRAVVIVWVESTGAAFTARDDYLDLMLSRVQPIDPGGIST
jgi:hypothetical protein